MAEFHSFLIASPQFTPEIEAVSCADWHLSTQSDPSKRFYSSADGNGLTELMRAEFADDYVKKKNNIPCYEIVIHAADDSKARNIQQLIYGGILLAYPDKLKNKLPSFPVENGSFGDMIAKSPFCTRFSHSPNAALGCRIARVAWSERKFIYAIEKLKLSWRLDWFTPHSASPRYGQTFENVDSEFEYHTDAAFAILAAFSVIEELGLEVRSSREKPRFLGSGSQEWNPVVREELVGRLAAYGIDTSETFPWVYRGEPTDIELKMRPQLGVLADYNDGEVVRDRELDLVDAVHYCSYLRNFIASHKFGDLTKSISPYDVYNTQSLARRLILSTLGFWRNYEP